ncbi:hypothetical protein, conserved [Leishmania tarentolae]|uniref:Uncharacterized protein n=1 Tax=Leishmania tarentolae TaxID=5689 RepID=A0A640KQC7_LEITA|nr:hypothetical protein, conserved [Leishmania tarentolae]
MMNAHDCSPHPTKAAPRIHGSARVPSEAGLLSSRQKLPSLLGAHAPSSTAVAALALTSKQRFFNEATVRSIAALLRHTAAQMEAAALQQAMEDPVASEYIMASGSRADEHNATTTNVSVPVASLFVDDEDRCAPSSSSASASGADYASGTWSNSSGHDTATHGVYSPPLQPQRAPQTLAQGPSTSALSSGTSGSQPQHSRCSAPLLEPRRRPRASSIETTVEQAIRTACAAASSPSYTYSFSEKWFGPPADALGLHAAHNSAGGNLSPITTSPAGANATGFLPRWQPPTPPSKLTCTSNASSVTTTVHSQSPNAAVFLAGPSSERSPATSPRLNPSNHANWNKSLAVVTSQPPLFFDNLLLDPSTNRYLFEGHAFREEVRALQVPAEASLPGASHTDDAGSEDNVTKHPRGSPSASLLLVREYIPISAECGIVADEQQPLGASGGSADAVVVQCFSLLPPQITHIQPNPYQLLPETAIATCLLVALPGCVTLATPLHVFLHDMRNGLMVGRSSLDCLLSSSHETTKWARGHLGSAAQSSSTSVSPSASTDRVSFLRPDAFLGTASGNGVSNVSAYGSPTKGLLEDPARDEDAIRIAIVHERLAQIVTPDLLDKAMQAIYKTLLAYSIQREKRRRMRVAIEAVHVLQRFFRRCLGVMERAVRRMVRLWRQLEVDARLKLQQYKPLPTAMERLDAVANSILQEHMLTSVSYKRAFIEAQWALRRRSFAKWRQAEEWDSVFASQVWRKESGSGVVPTYSTLGKRPSSARLTTEEEMRLESEFKKRQSGQRNTTAPCTVPYLPLTAAETYAEREQAAIRRFLSWYIDPQELLYLSHQKLLETLKGSVFQMAEVRLELKRAASKVKEDSQTQLAASVSCNSVQQHT